MQAEVHRKRERVLEAGRGKKAGESEREVL